MEVDISDSQILRKKKLLPDGGDQEKTSQRWELELSVQQLIETEKGMEKEKWHPGW